MSIVADEYISMKLRWIEQVACDPSLPPVATPVAVALASFINRTSLRAWPSVPTLAARINRKVAATRDALKALEAAGHLSVERTRGGQFVGDDGQIRAATNLYSWRLQPCENPEGKPSENPKGSQQSTLRKTDRQPSGNLGGNPPENRQATLRKSGGNTFEENPMKEPIEGTLSYGAVSAADRASSFGHDHEAAQAFQAVWTRWPKKTGRADAEKAMAEVLRQGAIWKEIATGAAAYVADRQRDDRGPAAVIQFTKPLARWLREGEWETWLLLPDAEAQAESALEALWREQDEISAAIRAGNPF